MPVQALSCSEVDVIPISIFYFSDNFDPAEDDPSAEGKCSVIVGLMQEYRRVGRAEGLENLFLGMNIFKVNYECVMCIIL